MITTISIILAALAIAAGVMGLVLMSQRDSARADAEDKRRDLSAVTKQLVDIDNERKRLEEVIASLHSEIDTLEKDLEACSDPKLVRDRLRQLLSPTTPASNPTSSIVSNGPPAKSTPN